jgi:hypothetical protein
VQDVIRAHTYPNAPPRIGTRTYVGPASETFAVPSKPGASPTRSNAPSGMPSGTLVPSAEE